MHKLVTYAGFTLLLLLLTLCSSGIAATDKNEAATPKTAIIIASFGTTVPDGVVAIENITERVRKAFPATEVRITFTSNIIRKVWKKRRANPKQWLDKGIPEEILYVKNIISTIGDLREDGYRNIIVQPTHMFYMEQSYDLNSYVAALGSINTMKAKWRPFDKLVMGRPALGMPGDSYSYHEDVDKAIQTLAADIQQAQEENATLVYMGHGNEHWSTGIYRETQKKINATYPQVKTLIGVVEGDPSLEDVLEQLAAISNKKILLKPFMIVAGDHAKNDMAGPEEDSWKSILEKKGYEVLPVLTGLGSNNAFADLFVDHIRDVAKDSNITLH